RGLHDRDESGPSSRHERCETGRGASCRSRMPDRRGDSESPSSRCPQRGESMMDPRMERAQDRYWHVYGSGNVPEVGCRELSEFENRLRAKPVDGEPVPSHPKSATPTKA